MEIGDDGSATFTLTVNDPDPRVGQANSNTVRYTVTGDTFQPTPNQHRQTSSSPTTHRL